MNLLDWLLMKTPEGATYLQVMIIFAVLFILVKYFVLPDIKEFQTMIKELRQGEGNDESNANYIKKTNRQNHNVY